MRELSSASARATRRGLAILAFGAAAACGESGGETPGRQATPEPPPVRQPTSDYAVYRTVLRSTFVSPAPDDHADGPPSCVTHEPLDSLTIEARTRFIHRGGAFRDSALAAELSPGAVPLLAALRALDAQPPVPVVADSFAVGVPVTLVPGAGDGLRVGVITLSRVAYDADSTAAMVHVARPCRVEPGPDPEEEPGPQGLSVLSVLRRQGEAWSVSEVVYLELE